MDEPVADLPAPPRPLTARARRRSWAELPVRVWLILLALLVGITGYFITTQAREGFKERWLLAHGVAIDADVETVDGDPHPHVKRRPRNQVWENTRISFDLNGRHAYVFALQPGVGTIEVGGKLPIRVDPNHPDRWHEATHPKPWIEQLASSGLLVPLCGVLIVIVFFQRQRVLNVWRQGELAPASVVGVRHNAAAPNSRLVRCHFNDTDRRVFSILVPADCAPRVGETVQLLRAPQKPSRAVLAQLYGWP